ncbi:MAG: TraR/DksA C4-type zinc finger protein [Saprospiraceae bacterium]|nr:TraR/DksA C4-type zinc finger protein [Saprospiraceae bacterium]
MDKTRFIENLEAEIEKTLSKIETYKEMAGPIAPDNAIGRVSRMDAIVSKSIVDDALREAQNKLSQLMAMKIKIHEHGFGLCTKCKKPIPEKRLLLMPQSMYCVDCSK